MHEKLSAPWAQCAVTAAMQPLMGPPQLPMPSPPPRAEATADEFTEPSSAPSFPPGSPPADAELPAFSFPMSPLDAGFPMSPLMCPSPAEWLREDFVRRNVRQVRSEYVFERCLGEGSFGKVHCAVHRLSGVRRAIKEIPKSGTRGDEFEQELRALVALDHPHIVNVIEYFDDEESYYLVMELCTGPDLFAYIVSSTESSAGPAFVPEREASVILRQCLKAVLSCHANGFVHRDLNARNFMLTGIDRTVKLIDFGLAARCVGHMLPEEATEVVGTAHYMAPEMLFGGEYTPAADLWSVGVLFYVLLTGLMLLPKDDAKKKAFLKKPGFISRRLQNCKKLQERGLSAQARDLLEWLLQVDPEQRIAASEALLHPFILAYCNAGLGPQTSRPAEFDRDLPGKMRRFGKAPRIKKIALLNMAHLADHERGLLPVMHSFCDMDTDGDGEISLSELVDGLTAHDIEVPADLEAVFAACDSRRSGRLTLVDFVAALLPSRLIDERLCREAFNVLDRDSKGRLGPEDLRVVCRSLDLEKCRTMVAQADLTGKGHFDFDDFQRLLRGADAVTSQPPRLIARRANPFGMSPRYRSSAIAAGSSADLPHGRGAMSSPGGRASATSPESASAQDSAAAVAWVYNELLHREGAVSREARGATAALPPRQDWQDSVASVGTGAEFVERAGVLSGEPGGVPALSGLS